MNKKCVNTPLAKFIKDIVNSNNYRYYKDTEFLPKIVSVKNNDESRSNFMYVCLCNNVKEKQIQAAIASGVDTLIGLKNTLNVATCCGCCEPMVNDYLEEHHAKLDVLAIAV